MPLEILNLNLEEEESSCAVNTNVSNSRNLLELLRPSAVLAHSDGDESLQAGSAAAVVTGCVLAVAGMLLLLWQCHLCLHSLV